MNPRTAALVTALLALLAAALWFAYRVWTTIETPPIPWWGYAALGLGVLLSLIVGIGLMALLFYSHRHGYDDAAHGEPWRKRE
jgi:hypothetical protein